MSSKSSDHALSYAGVAATLIQRKGRFPVARDPLRQRERDLAGQASELEKLKTVHSARIKKHTESAKLHDTAFQKLMREADALMAKALTLMAEAMDHSEQTRVNLEAIEKEQLEEERK